jgi:hypothetical protein
MGDGVRREFVRTLEIIDAAYAELLRLGGSACEGFREENGRLEYDLGTYEGYDITLSVGDGGSRIYAATNCHYPSLYILHDRLPDLDKAAENLRKESERLKSSRVVS